jgi:hypothetical protein
MSEATRFHIGDQVYCLNQEGYIVRGVVRSVSVTSATIRLSVGVQEAYVDRYNPDDYLPITVDSYDCFETADSLIDKQIERYKNKINYWEDYRKRIFK